MAEGETDRLLTDETGDPLERPLARLREALMVAATRAWQSPQSRFTGSMPGRDSAGREGQEVSHAGAPLRPKDVNRSSSGRHHDHLCGADQRWQLTDLGSQIAGLLKDEPDDPAQHRERSITTPESWLRERLDEQR